MASYYEWPFDYEREITISVLNEQTAVKRLNQFTRNISGCLHLAFSTARGPDSEMVGHVEHDNVILARARPVIFNASKPIFYGSFITTGNGAMLKGRFSVSCWQKMAFWLTTVFVSVIELFIIVLIVQPDNSPVISLNNMIMAFALPGIGLVTANSFDGRRPLAHVQPSSFRLQM
jgi:hypothetical protein